MLKRDLIADQNFEAKFFRPRLPFFTSESLNNSQYISISHVLHIHIKYLTTTMMMMIIIMFPISILVTLLAAAAAACYCLLSQNINFMSSKINFHHINHLLFHIKYLLSSTYLSFIVFNNYKFILMYICCIQYTRRIGAERC